jgi:hypothetical protein
MQLLELIILNISIKARTVHGIGIVLVRNWAILTQIRMPRGDHTFPYDASVVRSGTIIVHMISGEISTTDLPQRAVIFIVVG